LNAIGFFWWAVHGRKFSAHIREVTFIYRDRKKTMTLNAHEFISRFLLYVIPKGFVRGQVI
jgi:Putative transposase